MKRHRRNALAGLLMAVAGGELAADNLPSNTAPAVASPIIGTTNPDRSRWAKLAIVDVHKFPWDAKPRFRARTKTIFKGPKEGALIYTIFPPTWNTESAPPGRPPHYHHWAEWGYTLKGDSIMPEPVSPYQKNGMLYRKREGGWLRRPAYSLHGGSWETGGMRNQFPYYLLLFEEGDGSMVNVGPNGDHINPDFGKKPDPYLPDWKAVKQFTRPWLVDSQNDLEWEADPEVPGRLLKWLSDDLADGFRAQLVKIPPKWKAPEDSKRTYFENANRMRYVIYGDMQVWSFDGSDDAGKPVTATEDTFIYQPPRSFWGYGPAEVTQLGAVWLEVTYAKGLSNGGGPIEEPIAAK